MINNFSGVLKPNPTRSNLVSQNINTEGSVSSRDSRKRRRVGSKSHRPTRKKTNLSSFYKNLDFTAKKRRPNDSPHFLTPNLEKMEKMSTSRSKRSSKMGSRKSNRSRKSIFKDFGEENSLKSYTREKSQRGDKSPEIELKTLRKTSNFKPVSLDL